jgi:opacity protein-like surface antigen
MTCRTGQQDPVHNHETTMKKIYVSVMTLLIMTTVQAQNYGFDIFIRGGLGIPDAPSAYSTKWGKGPFVTSGFEFTLSQPLSVGVLGEYTRNSVNKDHRLTEAGTPDVVLTGGAMDIFSLALYLNYRLAGRVKGTFPYIILDAGVTHLKASNQTVLRAGNSETVPGSSETAFRSAWGIGIDVPLSPNVCLTVCGKYVYVFTENERTGFIPVEVGFKMVF